MIDKYKHLKETLLCAVEGQICDLPNADAKELGEVVDMIKDLEEAIYYSAITKAMKADEEEMEKSSRHNNNYRESEQMYYDDRRRYTEYNMGSGGGGSSGGSSSGGSGYTEYAQDGGNRGYTDYNSSMNYARDQREGRSGQSRRSYMEGKEMHKDKQSQMRELEKYMQELTSDMVEMIEHASPEEKQYLEKKLAALSQKIG